MKLYDFLKMLEGTIPRDLNFPWEFQGIEVGPTEESVQKEVDVRKVLLSLELGRDALSSIKRNDVDLVLIHNPLVEHPVMVFDDSLLRKLSFLSKEKVSVYLAQSSLVMMEGGFNDRIGKALELKRSGSVFVEVDGKEFPISRIFSYEGNFMVRDFARELASKLGIRYVRVLGDPEAYVSKVAVFTDELKKFDWVEGFKDEGVDLLITGILPYSVERYLSKSGMKVIAVGCKELKEFGMREVKNVIQSEILNVVFIYERSEKNYSEIFF